MEIDVTRLITNQSSKIYLDCEVNIPRNLLVGSRIDDLKNITLKGDITLNEDNELILTVNIKGIMILKDDLTLEPVEYTFDTDIEEPLPSNQNYLDITDILWQNILVEIPSKVRSTDEDIYLSGDGWRVISEDRYNEEISKNNNPFSTLDELLKTKEDK